MADDAGVRLALPVFLLLVVEGSPVRHVVASQRLRHRAVLDPALGAASRRPSPPPPSLALAPAAFPGAPRPPPRHPLQFERGGGVRGPAAVGQRVGVGGGAAALGLTGNEPD